MCVPPVFYYITVARFLPLPRFTQMSLFCSVPHYRRDNHHVHDTQETQPPDKLAAKRLRERRYIIILPTVAPINLYRLVII